MMSRNTISKVRILSLILALAMIFLTPMTMAANPQDPPPAPLEAVSDALEPEHAAGEPEARGGTARCLGGRNNRSSFDCPHGLEPRILD